MKANELMIGDWVYDSANECDVQVTYKDFRNDCIRILSDFEPIPLTPEILEKNGFSLDEFEWYESEVSAKERNYWINVAFRNDGVAIYDLDILTGGRSSICIHKDYVHELQHALRLCGIEKEFEL